MEYESSKKELDMVNSLIQKYTDRKEKSVEKFRKRKRLYSTLLDQVETAEPLDKK